MQNNEPLNHFVPEDHSTGDLTDRYFRNPDFLRYTQLIGELSAVYHDMSTLLGISDSVSMILYTICLEGGSIPLRELCRQTGLSKQTVNSSLRQLERNGYLLLEAVDGKSKRVVLTAAGQAYAEKTAVKIIDAETAVFDSWSEEDAHQYQILTKRFLDGLQQELTHMKRDIT